MVKANDPMVISFKSILACDRRMDRRTRYLWLSRALA